ncbi:MAG: terminase small subunit [Thermanaerothrix sp.]|uniref:terminase small subunit n=1 Tax=Thermanaerothrix sp. TaxID=2972675 RepID=UPI003C7BCBD1
MTMKDLSARQKRFLQALLTSKSAREAAQKAGIGEKTAYRWLRLPQVQSALAEAEGQILAETMRRLLGMAGGAADVLHDLLNNPRLLPTERLKVAQAVLDNLLRLRNVTTLEARLAELERKVEAAQAEMSPSD